MTLGGGGEGRDDGVATAGEVDEERTVWNAEDRAERRGCERRARVRRCLNAMALWEARPGVAKLGLQWRNKKEK